MILPEEIKTDIRMKRKSYFAIAGSIFISYVVFFSYVSFLKYDSFAYKDIDLTLAVQDVINILHCRFLTTGYGDATVFGTGHFSLVPFLLALAYALFSHPYTLLFLQTLFLGSGIILVYLIAEDVLGSGSAIGFSLLYAFYPALHYVNLFEVHFIAFSIPLLLGMYYFYKKKAFVPFALCVGLSLLCREETSLVITAFGVCRVLQERAGKQKEGFRWGLLPLLAGSAWLIFAAFINLPQLNSLFTSQKLPNLPTIAQLSPYYWLGTNLQELVATILTKPGYVINTIFSPAKLKYMFDLFAPLSFLPFLYLPGLLIVIFGMLHNLFSTWPWHNRIYFQYSSILIPFLFISAIMGFERLRRIAPESLRRFIVIIVVTILAASILRIGPLVRLSVIIPQLQKIKVSDTTRLKNYFVQQVPSHEPLIVTSELSSHLNDRHALSFFYIFVSDRHLNYLDEVKQKYSYALVDFNDPLTFQLIEAGLKDNLSSSCFIFQEQWGVKETVDSLAIFEKGRISDYRLIESLGISSQNLRRTNSENSDYAVTSFVSTNSFVAQVPVIALEAVIHKMQPSVQDYIPWVRVSNSRGQMFERPLYAPFRIYPFKYWKTNELVRIKAKVSLPKGFAAEGVTASISMQLYKREKIFDLVEKYVILNFL